MAHPKRRWQFSLRWLFVAIALLSLPMGWINYHCRWAQQRRQALQCGWVFELPAVTSPLQRPGKPTETSPPWPLAYFGERPRAVRKLELLTSATDEMLEQTKELFPELVVERAPAE